MTALVLAALLLNPVTVQARDSLLETKISIAVNHQPVKDILAELEQKTGIRFFYFSTQIDGRRRVSINVKDAPLYKVLDDLFKGTDTIYEPSGKQVLLKKERNKRASFFDEKDEEGDILVASESIPYLSPDIEVTGTIADERSQPLPGVNVVEKGTTNGTSTDASGRFSLRVQDERSVLVFSFIGFVTQEVQVGSQTNFSITLATDVMALEEVVVTGYGGTQRKADVTGALSAISVDEFEEQPVNRVDQILQGRSTGVQVTNVGGAPGGAVRIRIRGANSISGDNNPLYVLDGYVGADFTIINPNDIETIQVLKDASATAIYGSRGANGVIIITTKKGNKGSIKVNYNGQVSVSKEIGRYNTLNAGDFATIVNERAAATGGSPFFTQQQVNDFRTNGGTDWQDEIFTEGWGHEHQLGISGGSDKTTFLASANYLDQGGIIKNTDFKRYTIRSNIASQVSKKLSFRVNLTASRLINHNNGIISGSSNPLVQALAWAPTTPVYDANGDYTRNDPIGSVMLNPVALMFDRDNIGERSIGNLIGGLRYELIKGLSADIQYAVNYSNQIDEGYYGSFLSNNNPSASKTSVEQVTLQSTNALHYNRVINDVHKLDIVGVFETQQFTHNSFYSSANNLKFPVLKYYNLGLANSFSLGSGFSKWTLMSYLGRANYSFKDKYLLSATLRRDGSSKFRGANRYSVFPSMAVGWRLSEESFIHDLNVFTNLKLRGSWGLTGSQAINPYATQSTYNTWPEVAFNNTSVSSGITMGNPGNPDLRWETTEQVNVGMEMEFFDGRLFIEGDYFVKNTRDLLLSRPLPGYVGGGSIAGNFGEIQNKGWELAIGASPIDRDDFAWNSSFNISNVKNTVVSVGGIADRFFTSNNVGAGMSSQSEFVYTPGQPLAAYWGLRYLGTWKPDEADQAQLYGEVPGDSRYEDLNNDNAITAADFQIIGSGIPRTSAGWNNTFTFKGLVLNIFFQGIFGVDKLHYTKAAALAGSGDARQPILAEIKERYVPGVNETSDIPAFSVTNKVYTQSSRFMEKGDFIRLKNVSLSYNLPATVTQNKSSIKVFVSAMNLLTITDYTGIDPESSSVNGADTSLSIDYGAYPNSKTYTVGLSVTF